MRVVMFDQRIPDAADDATTVLTVRDDDRGLAPGSLPSSRGIRGMRERAMLIGAKLQIDSRGRGTQIELSIPTS
jgi:two-component system, NarL family, sensor histidine kinase UhpB